MGARNAEQAYMKNERKGGWGARIMLHCLGSCREMVTNIFTIFDILNI